MTKRKPKRVRRPLSTWEKSRLIVNTILFAIALAAVPKLSAAIMPWWWVKLSGFVAFVLLVWAIVLFILKDDIVGIIREVLAAKLTVVALLAILIAEGCIFAVLAAVLPRPEAPILRVLPHGAFLLDPLEKGSALVFQLNGSKQVTPIDDPDGAAVYVGRLEPRVAWRISDEKKEAETLTKAARATLQLLGDPSAPDVTVDRWQTPGAPVRSLAAEPGAKLRIGLGDDTAWTPLSIYKLDRGQLIPVIPPITLTGDRETTFVVMKEN